jgi:hypothetical protein
MELIGYPEMLINNFQSTLGSNPAEGRSQQHAAEAGKNHVSVAYSEV